jgi:hypothetical protein
MNIKGVSKEMFAGVNKKRAILSSSFTKQLAIANINLTHDFLEEVKHHSRARTKRDKISYKKIVHENEIQSQSNVSLSEKILFFQMIWIKIHLKAKIHVRCIRILLLKHL